MSPYDAEGNPLIRTTIATGETLAYGFDYRNRLVGLSYQDSGGHVTQQVLYTYDTSDRRISKQVSTGSKIVGKYVFYNNSSYDGYDPNAVASTDASAIAPDKSALLPGYAATPFNFTNYDKGINGVIIDVAGLPAGASLSASDFGFLAGNTSDPSTWTGTPSPSIVSVFPGAGVNGSARIELIWSDYTIRNQWLQVTVKADGNTALQGPQVFYFGNLVGETGHNSSSGSFTVNIGDVLGTKFHSGNPAGITSWFDFNRDGQTGIGDVVTVKFDSGNSLVALNAPDQPRAGYEAYVYGPNSSADDLLLVVDSTEAVTHRLLEGPQAHMVLADEDTSKSSTDPNRVEWLLGDNQQTVGDQVNDGGTPTDHLVYDSYGNVVSQTNASQAPRFQYTGMQADQESGLFFDFRRYYDPKDGRFISQDPKSFAAGDTNLYRYVGNDPLNRIDPTGLEEQATTDNADAAAQASAAAAQASAAALAQAGSGQGSATPQGSAGWLTLGTGPKSAADLSKLPRPTFGGSSDSSSGTIALMPQNRGAEVFGTDWRGTQQSMIQREPVTGAAGVIEGVLFGGSDYVMDTVGGAADKVASKIETYAGTIDPALDSQSTRGLFPGSAEVGDSFLAGAFRTIGALCNQGSPLVNDVLAYPNEVDPTTAMTIAVSSRVPGLSSIVSGYELKYGSSLRGSDFAAPLDVMGTTQRALGMTTDLSLAGAGVFSLAEDRLAGALSGNSLVSDGAKTGTIALSDTTASTTIATSTADASLAANPISWVEENAGMRGDAASYSAGVTGARSNLISGLPEVPQLGYQRLDGSLQLARFDGLDGNVLIDRKLAVVTSDKAFDQALHQSTALMENGLTGRWEVPTAYDAARAQQSFNTLGITNISIKVVPK